MFYTSLLFLFVAMLAFYQAWQMQRKANEILAEAKQHVERAEACLLESERIRDKAIGLTTIAVESAESATSIARKFIGSNG